MQSVLETKTEKLKDSVKHYDIYVYKDWTLREVQEPEMTATWDPNNRKWIKRPTGNIKSTIVWGIHQPCDIRGFIVITAEKASCNKCKEKMPPEVFDNMYDALEMMKQTLDSRQEDNLWDF